MTGEHIFEKGYDSATGAADNAVLLELAGGAWKRYLVQAASGVVDVQVTCEEGPTPTWAAASLYPAGQGLAGTAVAQTSSTGVFELHGRFHRVRFLQQGATAAQCRVVAYND